MLTKFYFLVTTVLMQGSSVAPPAPKMGPAPPVGDPVPIDDFIWVLICVALILAVRHFYILNQKSTKFN